MERNEVRIQPSNQRYTYKPFCVLFSGFMFLEKGSNSGPENKRVVLTALRMCGPNSS